MKVYSSVQTLAKVQRELWWVIRLLGTIEVQLDGEAPNYSACLEVAKVLRAVAAEIAAMIGRERGAEENSRNIRQAEEFALKAKIAKAGEVEPAHRQLCPSDQSHK